MTRTEIIHALTNEWETCREMQRRIRQPLSRIRGALYWAASMEHIEERRQDGYHREYRKWL